MRSTVTPITAHRRLFPTLRTPLFVGSAFLLLTTACDGGPGMMDADADLEPGSWEAKIPIDDGDGIPEEQDFCPGTATGATVDDHGCASNQAIEDTFVPGQVELADIDGDGVRTRTEGLLDEPPPAQVRQRGFVAMTAARTQAGPLIFFAHEKSITEEDDRIDVNGDVAFATADGFVVMTDADLRFSLNEVGDVRGITGFANVPLPEFGLLGGAGVSGFAQAIVGLRRGNILAEELDAPLSNSRDYLYFILEASASITVASFELSKSAPGATVVYDPTDPFIFMRGELVGLGSLGPLEDVGVGLSFGGHLPWEAAVLPERFEKFDGNVYLEGVLSFGSIPIVLDGEGVMRVENNELFSAQSQLGFNGAVSLQHELFGVFKVGIELAESSATVTQGIDVTAVFAGVPSQNFLTSGPIIDNASFMSGVVSSKIEESYLEGTGDFALDGQWISARTPFVVDDIPLLDVTFRADSNGATLTGRVDLIPDLPGVILSAGVEAEVFIPADGTTYTILFRGDAEIDGVFTVNAQVGLGPGGITIGANTDSP